MRTKQIIDHHYHLCTESKRERESKRDEKGDVICNSGIDYCYLSLFMLGMNFTFLYKTQNLGLHLYFGTPNVK